MGLLYDSMDEPLTYFQASFSSGSGFRSKIVLDFGFLRTGASMASIWAHSSKSEVPVLSATHAIPEAEHEESNDPGPAVDK